MALNDVRGWKSVTGMEAVGNDGAACKYSVLISNMLGKY